MVQRIALSPVSILIVLLMLMRWRRSAAIVSCVKTAPQRQRRVVPGYTAFLGMLTLATSWSMVRLPRAHPFGPG
jgi:hypothetical protein